MRQEQKSKQCRQGEEYTRFPCNVAKMGQLIKPKAVRFVRAVPHRTLLVIESIQRQWLSTRITNTSGSLDVLGHYFNATTMRSLDVSTRPTRHIRFF